MSHTVDSVLSEVLPDGVQPHQITAIAVVCEYVDENGDTLLAYQRNDEVGVWRHIGMLTATCDQWRSDLVDRNDG
jgi:hypothetical protein